jgi:hypothetical protein
MSDESIARALNMKPLEETDAKKVKKTIPQVVEGEMVDDVKNLPQESVFQPPVPIEKLADENLADIELAKKNIENIINLGDDAVREMTSIAKQSESPRAFEVVSTLMKTLLDANKDYVEMSTKRRYAKEEDTSQQAQVTNNNLIVSTSDLLKMIKGEKPDG